MTVENQELKKAGLKLTTPRLKIWQILQQQNSKHLSAEEVYKTLVNNGEEVGLATIYRVLTQFEEAGLIRRHNFEEGRAVFELDQGAHHDHMFCIRCGQVEEFFDATIEARQQTIAEQMNFTMTDHSLVMYGVCTHCG